MGSKEFGSGPRPTGAATLAAAALLAASLVPAATAASFDCRKATNERERIVCADPELSQADEDLAEAYRDALAQLSPEGRRVLRSGQSAWLRYLDEVCEHPVRWGGAKRECVEELYAQRAGDMGGAVRRVGPFVFSLVDAFRVDKHRERGKVTAVVRRQAMWPRIDGIETEAARAWNAAAEAALANLEGGDTRGESCDPGVTGEWLSGYQLVGATPSLVSLTNHTFGYCDGDGHSRNGLRTLNLTLEAMPRALAAGEVFLPGGGWERAVTAHAEEWLSVPANNGTIDGSKEAARRMADAWGRSQWALSPDGVVTIHDLGTNLPGPTEITTPWHRIGRHLKPGLELPR